MCLRHESFLPVKGNYYTTFTGQQVSGALLQMYHYVSYKFKKLRRRQLTRALKLHSHVCTGQIKRY